MHAHRRPPPSVPPPPTTTTATHVQAMCSDYYTLDFMDPSVDTAPIAPALAAFFDDVLQVGAGRGWWVLGAARWWALVGWGRWRLVR